MATKKTTAKKTATKKTTTKAKKPVTKVEDNNSENEIEISNADKKSVKEIVTDKILARMEKGEIPWTKPWFSYAQNFTTKKNYSFLNQLLLDKSGYFLSFKQITAKGGKVKKGSKAHMVTFYKMLRIKETDETTGEETVKTIPMLRYYNVFHQDDIEGIKFPKRNSKGALKKPQEIVTAYLNRENIPLKNFSVFGTAGYVPSEDSIEMPDITMFNTSEHYYASLFHEMVHSTLKKERCDREHGKKFGDEKYSKEELIAEIGSAILCSMAGIDSEKLIDNSSAYLQNWLKHLKGDKSMLISAAGKAEKAVNYILTGKQYASEDKETENENQSEKRKAG